MSCYNKKALSLSDYYERIGMSSSLLLAVRKQEEIAQRESQKAEFEKTWIGRRRKKINLIKEKQEYLKRNHIG